MSSVTKLTFVGFEQYENIIKEQVSNSITHMDLWSGEFSQHSRLDFSQHFAHPFIQHTLLMRGALDEIKNPESNTGVYQILRDEDQSLIGLVAVSRLYPSDTSTIEALSLKFDEYKKASEQNAFSEEIKQSLRSIQEKEGSLGASKMRTTDLTDPALVPCFQNIGFVANPDRPRKLEKRL